MFKNLIIVKPFVHQYNQKYRTILWKELSIPILVLVFLFIGGALGYRLFYPEVSWNKIFFMTAITLSSVGYSDILQVSENPWATWFTIGIIFIAMIVILYSMSTLAAFFTKGVLQELFWHHAQGKKIEKMNQHYIICGIGQTGKHVAEELHEGGVDFVSIDIRQDKIDALRQLMPSPVVIQGDATLESTLYRANIAKAKSLVVCLSSDKDNLYLTLTARLINPNLTIVARVSDEKLRSKLLKAGANYVVSPNFMGGIRIGQELLKPDVINFLDSVLDGSDQSVSLEQLTIPQHSPLVGRSIEEAEIQEKTGLTIIGYSSDRKTYLYNLSLKTQLLAGGVLLFIGCKEQYTNLKKLLHA